MKLTNIDQVDAFLEAANKCEGAVYLTSPDGDRFNLKSALCQYIAIAQLLGEHGQDLELWCDYKDDEVNFFRFFNKFPEVL